MKLSFKILILILLSIIFLISAFLFFPGYFSQSILSSLFNMPVTVGETHIDFGKKALIIDGIKLNKPSGYITKASVDFINTDIYLEDITIYSQKDPSYEHQKPIFKAESATFNAPPLFVLLATRVMDSAELNKPFIQFTKARDKKIEFTGTSTPHRGGLEYGPSRLYKTLPTRKLIIRDGRVSFTDFFVSKKPVITNLSEVDISLSIHRPMTQSFEATIDGFATLENPSPGRIRIRGKAKPFVVRPDYDLKITARNIDLLQFLPYYQKKCPVLVKQGRINLEGKFFVKNAVQNSYYKVETFSLFVEPKRARGFADNLLGIPIASLVAALETGKGQIVLDCYARGSLKHPKFSPGPISQERIISATVDILKRGLDFLKGL